MIPEAYAAGRAAKAMACCNTYELATWFSGLGDELTAQRLEREARAEASCPA